MTDVSGPASPLRVTAQVRLAADPHQVWDLVTDWSRQHEWIWATQVRGGRGLGATVVGWTGVGPVGFSDTMVISEWEPPRRCVVRHTGKVVRGSGIFEVIPDGTGCVFRWTEDLELPVPPAVGRLAGPVIRPVAGWGLASSLRRFARLVLATGFRARWALDTPAGRAYP